MSYAGASGPARLVKAVFMGLMLAASSAKAQIPFQDGFEGGTSMYSWIAPNQSPNATIVNSGCQAGGGCFRFHLLAGSGEQSAYVARPLASYTGQQITFAWYQKFVGQSPNPYTWNRGNSGNANEHKLLIVNNTAGSQGRLLVTIQGAGTAPVFETLVEGLDSLGGPVFTRTNTPWPNDGQYHKVEVQFTRAPGPTGGNVKVWLDGSNTPVIDQTGRACAATCGPLTDVAIGAYINQGSAATQDFYLDGISVYAGPRTAQGPVTPPPPAPINLAAALDAIGDAAEEVGTAQGQVTAATSRLAAAQTKLEQAVDALDPQ